MFFVVSCKFVVVCLLLIGLKIVICRLWFVACLWQVLIVVFCTLIVEVLCLVLFVGFCDRCSLMVVLEIVVDCSL